MAALFGPTTGFCGQPISLLLSLFVTAVFMALFPDLDTTSVPRRWFFLSHVCNVGDSLFQKELSLLSARFRYTVASEYQASAGPIGK